MTTRFASIVSGLLCMAAATAAWGGQELALNGGFENGFENWTRWGENAALLTMETTAPHSGANCARIDHGHNALYFTIPMPPERAYELRFFYRQESADPSSQVALNYYKKDGAFRSAGYELAQIVPPEGNNTGEWQEFRKVFMPSSSTASCQVAFSTEKGTTLWIDDVSVMKVPRPAGLEPPPDPWEGLKHRTARPLFKELLTAEPGGYRVVCWAHDLQPQDKTSSAPKEDKSKDDWAKTVPGIYEEAARAGMGFMDLPGRLDSRETWRTPQFHREMTQKHGVRYDVWTEGGASISAGLKNGAELLNPSGKALGRRPSLSWVDPKYVEAQAAYLRKIGKDLRGEPFVGYYYGKDEPTIHIPEGEPGRWGTYGQAMAAEVRDRYGYGRFEVPQPGTKAFENDPNKPLRWIAYNRWVNDRFAETRCALRAALRESDPSARYSPADFWFMSGFGPYDFSRLAPCTDLMEIDPYASSAERRRGRGVYNHGFGAKLVSDLTDKPVRVIAQAFDYAGYDMSPEDLREWVSQAMRCGASAISYYTMDRPRATHPDRWKMMLHLSRVLTRMKRIDIPRDADTAVLYCLNTHMSHGYSTGGDQVYAAHALVGELAGSWFRFISDTQLERGERKLDGYKVVYLPLGRYMTTETAAMIEAYVRGGGVLVCGDAEAFACDLAGNSTTETRVRILGVDAAGPRKADSVVLKTAAWGLAKGTTLRLFGIELWGEKSPGRARELKVVAPGVEVLGTYPDGAPAIVSRALGKGRVITFAANPFAPQVTVDKSQWPALVRGLQKELGCKVDQPIWRFVLPAGGA